MTASLPRTLGVFLARQRRRLRNSEAAFIVLALVAGIAAGAATLLQQAIAHGLQRLFYGVSINRLSALGAIHHPWKLVVLPLGGAVLVIVGYLMRRRSRISIDVVEANALHGGRIPFFDNLVIAAQTLVSNGAGASVGLEAAYAQMGGGIASTIGQWFALRRTDLRTLVGAGAGSAIGAAFGAPLTGAFYAFEVVIGNYTPAVVAPVIAAALAGASVSRILGVEPYLIATTAKRSLGLDAYLAYCGLGIVSALLGILIMRLVAVVERQVQKVRPLDPWRPILGGLLLVPLALASPQTLSAGHGALHLDLALRPAVTILCVILLLKVAASVISLSFGFRGGLFFASLFLGSLLGQIYANLFAMMPGVPALDPVDASLVGMAALSVSIVGGPMTMAILMLETTHDFTLMGVVLAATLVSSALTRELFGYSFSTWRLHLRGSAIRSPRDIGWMASLNAGALMRRDWRQVPADMTFTEFRHSVPLGSVSKAVLTDSAGRYVGMVPTAVAWGPEADEAAPVSSVAKLAEITLSPESAPQDIIDAFDRNSADELAVVNGERRVIGIVSENYARRRLLEQSELSQRALFGEAR